jgi:hypothetical protein
MQLKVGASTRALEKSFSTFGPPYLRKIDSFQFLKKNFMILKMRMFSKNFFEKNLFTIFPWWMQMQMEGGSRV